MGCGRVSYPFATPPAANLLPIGNVIDINNQHNDRYEYKKTPGHSCRCYCRIHLLRRAEPARHPRLSLPPHRVGRQQKGEVYTYAGSSVISEVYPLDRFPLFVRKGAVLPVAGEHPTFHVYPGADYDATLHLPTGEGVEYSDYHETLDSSTGELTVHCPSLQTASVVVRGASDRTLTAEGRTLHFNLNQL